ncbi:NAD-binding protein [Trichothermofontia sichuanensis B231]|uniref:potassium channel family protein n=1 Tax=Trichothermofontia sichuanensis TaxID=3045816 RepID=UPI00224825C2|nr:potassium channel protein [Trichothermofontia sichuanensis]UZQ53162.1 NAD-binding protein [Trichothermofontia sichuanensis B231]
MYGSPLPAPAPGPIAAPPLDHFLVCGLGSLGEHCVMNLKQFGVEVSAIEQSPPPTWEIPELATALTHLVVGDCRQAETLKQAGIDRCRAILLVTSDEQVNLEAAFAARLLNPQVRVVVRSAKQELNQLLAEHLQNYVAFEPTQLSADAFAVAALGNDTLGYFQLEEQFLRVTRQHIPPGHPWCNQRQVQDLNTRRRRVLAHWPAGFPTSEHFYQWDPEALIGAGDTLIYIETEADRRSSLGNRLKPRAWLQRAIAYWQELLSTPRPLAHLRQQIYSLWQQGAAHQIQRVVIVCALTIVTLLFLGTTLIYQYFPAPISRYEAFQATVVLLLGGYGDIFGGVELTDPLPRWLQSFSLGLTLIGTVFVGVVYALLTEKLLTAQFQFLARRPPIPTQGHTIIIGLGRVGRQVATRLQQFKQPLVGVHSSPLPADTLPQMPLVITQDMTQVLPRLNLMTAKSVVAVTEDELANLEAVLTARAAHANANLVIRTYNRRFAENIGRLFPDAQVLCASELAAQAFATAAFGENVLTLLYFDRSTILVTEYQVETHDTLNQRLLAEVAYGYGVVPILHQRSGQTATLLPKDELRLQAGDRLIVLATIEGLQRIEQGNLLPRQWYVHIDRLPLGADHNILAEEARTIVALIAGCRINEAIALMQHSPGTLPLPLYRHQAQRLAKRLRRAGFQARVVQS